MKKSSRTFIWCSKCKSDQEPRLRRWCNKCYREIMNKRRKDPMKMYTKCSICHKEGEPRTHMYCIECQRDYQKKYMRRKRYIRKITKQSDVKNEIKTFVDKILNNKLEVDLYDINMIIEYFNMTCQNINLYDNQPSGRQVFNMFHYIKKWAYK